MKVVEEGEREVVAGTQGGCNENGNTVLICMTRSAHSVLSPLRGPSRMASVCAQPSYIRKNT